MKVYVYFNLRTKLWSVKALEGERKGLVIAHREALTLHNVTFKVSEASRQTVIRKQERSVHAGCLGEWFDNEPYRSSQGMRQFSYNPYKGPYFYDRDTGTNLHAAAVCVFDGRIAAYQ